jgi:flagellar hook-length control protein FliK
VAPSTPGTPADPLLPVAPQATATEAPPTAGAAPDGVVIPAELLAAKTDADAGAKGKDTNNAPHDGAPDLARLPAPPASDSTAVAPAPMPAAPTPHAPPAPLPDAAAAAPAPTVAPVAAQPAATPFTAVPVAAGVPQLTRASVTAAAERVQDLVRIATTRNGGARAILQLKPVELGTVDVHLRTTREGLVATIAAHDQVGLDALQQAGGELRRSLEERGVQLHRLDLQLGAGQGSFGNGADARDANAGSRRSAAPSAPAGADDDDLTVHDLSTTTVTSTPAGVLVDVQA